MRKNAMWLFEEIGQYVPELVLTTNGSQLEKYAADLKKAGVKRVNISIDSLQPERFKKITRTQRSRARTRQSAALSGLIAF